MRVRYKIPVCSTFGLNVQVLLSSCSSLYLNAKSHQSHRTGKRGGQCDTNRRARSLIASRLSASWNSRSSMGTVSADATPAKHERWTAVNGEGTTCAFRGLDYVAVHVGVLELPDGLEEDEGVKTGLGFMRGAAATSSSCCRRILSRSSHCTLFGRDSISMRMSREGPVTWRRSGYKWFGV